MTKHLSANLQSHLRTISVNKTSRHAVSAARFPAKPPFSCCFHPHRLSTKPRHEGSQNMLPRRILAIIVFFFFLVLQQQANVNLMLCCLLFMQNLRAQNVLLTRFIRRQRNRYRRRAPYYWTLPRPVESWFEIHYTDRTIPGDYFQDSATYHLSNHFRNKTPSLLFSKICLSLACSRGS